VRILLTLGGFDWKNNDMSGQDGSWAALKPKTKWGQIPMMEANGMQFTQSRAMGRYIAKQVKVGGKPLYPVDLTTAFLVDEFVDALEDVRAKFAPTFAMKEASEKEKARKDLMTGDGAAAVLMAKIEAQAGTEFAVGSSMSLADVWVTFVVGMMSSGFLDGLDKSLLAPYPKLLAISTKVLSQPQLKAYYKERAAAKPLYKCFVV